MPSRVNCYSSLEDFQGRFLRSIDNQLENLIPATPFHSSNRCLEIWKRNDTFSQCSVQRKSSLFSSLSRVLSCSLLCSFRARFFSRIEALLLEFFSENCGVVDLKNATVHTSVHADKKLVVSVNTRMVSTSLSSNKKKFLKGAMRYFLEYYRVLTQISEKS